jgi:hypothetical protein
LRVGATPQFSVAPVYHGARLDADGWYAACIASGMFTMLTVPGLTLLFLSVVIGLGATFVWMLWEIEQTFKPRRNSDRFG